VAPAISDLQALQQELSKLDKELMGADQEVGVVRSLIDKKGLPLQFYPDALYDRRVLAVDPNTTFDDSSDEGTGSVESADGDGVDG